MPVNEVCWKERKKEKKRFTESKGAFFVVCLFISYSRVRETGKYDL